LLAASPHDEGDLRLVVDLLTGRRQRNRRAWSSQSIAELREKGGLLGRIDTGLRGVRAVVEPDADDLVGVGEWRQGLRMLDRFDGGISRRGGEVLDPTGRDQLPDADSVDAEQSGSIEYPGVGQDARTALTIASVRDQPHRGHPIH